MRLLALVVVAVLLAPAGALAATCPKTSVTDIEDEVMCLQCGVPLNLSEDAPSAKQERAFIQSRVNRCESKQQIKDELVAQFGPAVLAAPPRKGFHWLVWLLPPAGFLLAAAVIGVLVWRWSRRRADDAPADSNGRPPLDPELERRLDQELARFDG